MSVFCSVPERIAKLRNKAPELIAVAETARTLNYTGLDIAANEFANYLEHLGVAPGDIVAISMERSIDWIVAALGTMRAGAAYVPLDAAWPDSRLSFAVKDSGASVLVAREYLHRRLQLTLSAVDPIRDAVAIASAPKSPDVPIDPESLAYIIYTSGSSGVPKGVEVTHANLDHLIAWHQDAFHVTPQDRASHLAGLGFDAAVWEIWPTLVSGASLCLVDDAVRSSPDLLQQWLLRERITISFIPTVHTAPLMSMSWPETTALRLLLTGGEALHQMPRPGLPFAVVNNYGPTESTVVATSAVLTPGSATRPPIGRPIGQTAIYFLDNNFQPVPDGTMGEMFVGGPSVARGYRNLPEATRKSFLPDPFSAVPNARMYRTGDRGVRRSDGEIEFRGRLDRQAKIRGYRIELDEIDTVLNAQPNLAFGTAIVRKGARGEDEIVAYVLPADRLLLPTTAELQAQLLKVLPEYMLPATFVRLDSLPLSRNGKVDLTLLPAPSASNALERTPAKVASSPTEKQLLSLVRGLLEQPELSVEDNFFLAGGHSLLGMQLVVQLRNTFNVDITLKELYNGPTVERLASVIDSRTTENRLTAIWKDVFGASPANLQTNFFDLNGNNDLVVKLQQRILEDFGKRFSIDELVEHASIDQQVGLIHIRGERTPELPAGVLPLRTHPSQNAIFWVHYLSSGLARAMAEDQAFIHVGLASEDIASLGPTPTLQEIAACFVEKVLGTQPQGPYIIGGYCLGGILAYEMSAQLQAAGHKVSLLVMLDTPSPTYFESRNILTPRLRHPRYLLKRVSQIGLNAAFQRVGKRLSIYLSEIFKLPPNRTEVEEVQYMIEEAAAFYEARQYDGNVALILAADHPPHIDFLSEWRQLIPHNLHSQYLVAHHSELMNDSFIQTVANSMAAQIKRVAEIVVEEAPVAVGSRLSSGSAVGDIETFSKPIFS